MVEAALKKVGKVPANLSLQRIGKRRAAVAVDEDLEREDTLEIQAFRKVLLKGGEFRGARGLKGENGDTGETGRRGRRGLRGDTGEHGEIGLMGKSIKGANGVQGERGLDGLHGRQGESGGAGSKGDKGDIGPSPRHKWEGTKLSFEQPNGRFGRAVNLQGPSGGRGGIGASAKQIWDSITLLGTELNFTKPKAGALGPSTVVDLADIVGLNRFVVVIVTLHVAGVEDVIYVDDQIAAAPVLIELPPAGDAQRVYYVKKRGAAFVVTIAADGIETIDGENTIGLTQQNEAVRLHSDGANWNIL